MIVRGSIRFLALLFILISHAPAKAQVKTDNIEDESSDDRYLIPRFRSFWTLRVGGFFPTGALKDRVNNGWTVGGSARIAVFDFMEPELSIDWLYASRVVAGQDNSVHLIPIVFGLRFNRAWRNFNAFVAPEIGGIFWHSGTLRLVDREKSYGHGFDFVGATSLGVHYEWRENSIFSLRYRVSFASGYINQIYSTFCFEWSKRF